MMNKAVSQVTYSSCIRLSAHELKDIACLLHDVESLSNVNSNVV
jgi:hypothetical protein